MAYFTQASFTIIQAVSRIEAAIAEALKTKTSLIGIFVKALPLLGLVTIVLGGTWWDFTPTEAGAVGAFVSLLAVFQENGLESLLRSAPRNRSYYRIHLLSDHHTTMYSRSALAGVLGWRLANRSDTQIQFTPGVTDPCSSILFLERHRLSFHHSNHGALSSLDGVLAWSSYGSGSLPCFGS
jgi:hypothetical protein